jgi:hypothetical protein
MMNLYFALLRLMVSSAKDLLYHTKRKGEKLRNWILRRLKMNEEEFEERPREYNTSDELPYISIDKKRHIGNFETESVNLSVRGYSLNECEKTINRIKKWVKELQ